MDFMAMLENRIERQRQRAKLADRTNERNNNAETEAQQRVQHAILVSLVMFKDELILESEKEHATTE